MNEVFLIYVDGGTWNNLEDWIGQGELPALQRIVTSGKKGITKSCVPANTFAASPSFMTGKNIGKIGIISPTLNGQEIRFEDIPHKPFWEYLADADERPFIVNVGVTYPPKISKGLMITGELMLPSGTDSQISDPVKKQFDDFHRNLDRIRELQKEFMKNEDELFRLYMENLMLQFDRVWSQIESDEPTFLLYRIGIIDDVQHFLWHRPEYVLRIYKEIDRQIGLLVGRFPKKNFVIFSDHGAEAKPKRVFYMNAWLMNQGFLRTLGGRALLPVLTAGQSTLEKLLPLKTLGRIMTLLRKPQKKSLTEDITDEYNLRIPGIDYSRSDAFLSYPWGISIIDRDRKDYDRIRNKMIERLQELVDAGYLREVCKTENIYWGPKRKHLPDIIFVLDGSKYACVRPTLRKKITGRLKPSDYKMTGYHDHDRLGIFVAHGPDIKKGILKEPIQIYDFAAIVLESYGLTVPEDMDGRVDKELFT